MARFVETSVLSKRDWKRFEAQLFHNRNKKVTAEEYEEMKKNHDFIASLFVENNSGTKNGTTNGSKDS